MTEKENEVTILYVDPPWRFSTQRYAGQRPGYPTLSPAEFAELDVRPLLSENAVCAMWCPDCLHTGRD